MSKTLFEVKRKGMRCKALLSKDWRTLTPWESKEREKVYRYIDFEVDPRPPYVTLYTLIIGPVAIILGVWRDNG